MFSSGFVIISETDRHAYVLARNGSFGTLATIWPRVFRSYAEARHKLRTYVANGGRALLNPGPCRIISARAAGVRR